MENLVMGNNKRVRDNSEDTESEVKRLRQNLLADDDDGDYEFCTTNWDLDSFMKSFEDEITTSPSAAAGDAASESPAPDIVDLLSESGESKPDLGYLLEASDYELGIPPTISSPGRVGIESGRVESYSSELGGENWDIPSYDSFLLGFGGAESKVNDGHVELDGLFDFSDLGYGSSEFGWRSETLPAQ